MDCLTGAMENYYNYFTEIERYYQTKRENFTLLSTLDWVLIETWKNDGVPLDTVLKGMDRAFSRSKRKISSLAYCANAVAEVAGEQKDLRTEEPAPPEFSPEEVERYLTGLSDRIRALGERVGDLGGRIESVADALVTLDATDLRTSESALNALEEKLVALLSVAAPEETLVAVRSDVGNELQPFRSRMTAPQLAMLEQQLWKRKLMERFGVPRLSFFYLI
jgi:hypothetical protein